ncbi:acyl-CoA desaturase [Hansschlegelia plantiphila]|uniref:Acyl-CoA desaturase n=1 Tax=Hansschlegelia plantiphila TaxID=374655 RepID=A0A9W6J343_9HYPH|nr:acyl-CoA desaturase [Hansschlegelia plantiphila]GLK69457.1 acyl-CoA desaturase [Hansschlegelia plantiphila]
MVALDFAPLGGETAEIIHPRAGVKVGGPAALRKRIEYGTLVGSMATGSLFAVWWLLNHSMTWIEWTSLGVGYVIINVGVGMGYHRYFTHKSFETSKPMRYAIGVLAQLCCQGSVLRWVADHRRHHAHADHCGDVHSPVVDGMCNNEGTLKGLFHSHIGWLMDPTTTDLDVFARDLQQDPVVMWCHRTRWFWAFFSLAGAPFAFGYAFGGWEHGVGSMLVGGFLRTFLFLNMVLAVNSIGHTFGTERFDNHSHAKNNWVLALLTFGDGWHNNHHRHPRNAYAGLTWWEIDVNGYIISGLEKLGLVWNVVRIPAAAKAD